MKKTSFGTKRLILMLLILSVLIAVYFKHAIVPLFPVMTTFAIIYATRTQRKLLKTKYSPIYNLSSGLVKIQGTVGGQNTLETPFFKEQCIAYSYEEAKVSYDSDGEEYVSGPKNQKNDFQDFHLTNATGKIQVIADHLDLSLLPSHLESRPDIKYTERTLKNGDLINILGYAIKNNHQQLELRGLAEHPLVISTSIIEEGAHKTFKIIKHLLPYLVLMYLSVNYFLFFAPVKLQLEQSGAFLFFIFFGLPIVSLILAWIGNKLGFSKTFYSSLAGVCFTVLILSFPLVCFLLITETEYYRILCIWLSVFFCTSLAFIMNREKLAELSLKDDS